MYTFIEIGGYKDDHSNDSSGQSRPQGKVNNLAKAEGKSVSEAVRELLAEYIKNRDIDLYIDDLWERIGRKLTSRGVRPQDIQRSIQKVRMKKWSRL